MWRRGWSSIQLDVLRVVRVIRGCSGGVAEVVVQRSLGCAARARFSAVQVPFCLLREGRCRGFASLSDLCGKCYLVALKSCYLVAFEEVAT